MGFVDLLARIKTVDADGARRWIAERSPDSFTLLDVRQPQEYERGHIPGALLIPLGELPERLDEVPRDRPVLAY